MRTIFQSGSSTKMFSVIADLRRCLDGKKNTFGIDRSAGSINAKFEWRNNLLSLASGYFANEVATVLRLQCLGGLSLPILSSKCRVGAELAYGVEERAIGGMIVL